MSLKSIFAPVTSERVAEALSAGMNPKSLRARLMLLNTRGVRQLAFTPLGVYLFYLSVPFLVKSGTWGALFVWLTICAAFVWMLAGLPGWIHQVVQRTFGKAGAYHWLTPLSENKDLYNDFGWRVAQISWMKHGGIEVKPVYVVNRALYGADYANVDQMYADLTRGYVKPWYEL